MNINYMAIGVATVLQFIIGAVWYSFMFGKLWGRIHGFDALTKEAQQQMMKKIGPFYVLQFLITIITTFVLALFIAELPEWNPYVMAGFFWIGFVVPTQISGVIFGGTESRWIIKKILVMAGASIACLISATWIMQLL
jgi:hypothetical protein